MSVWTATWSVLFASLDGRAPWGRDHAPAPPQVFPLPCCALTHFTRVVRKRQLDWSFHVKLSGEACMRCAFPNAVFARIWCYLWNPGLVTAPPWDSVSPLVNRGLDESLGRTLSQYTCLLASLIQQIPWCQCCAFLVKDYWSRCSSGSRNPDGRNTVTIGHPLGSCAQGTCCRLPLHWIL